MFLCDMLYVHLICCDHNTCSPFYNLILYHKHFDIYYNLLGKDIKLAAEAAHDLILVEVAGNANGTYQFVVDIYKILKEN